MHAAASLQRLHSISSHNIPSTLRLVASLRSRAHGEMLLLRGLPTSLGQMHNRPPTANPVCMFQRSSSHKRAVSLGCSASSTSAQTSTQVMGSGPASQDSRPASQSSQLGDESSSPEFEITTQSDTASSCGGDSSKSEDDTPSKLFSPSPTPARTHARTFVSKILSSC